MGTQKEELGIFSIEITELLLKKLGCMNIDNRNSQ